MDLLVCMMFAWAAWAPENFGRNMGSMYAHIEFGFKRGYNRSGREL